MRKIHVTMVDRASSSESVGGDTIQINEIYNFLVQNGFSVIKTKKVNEDRHETDLVILFNLTNPNELFLNYQKIQKRKMPFIIFPIFWDLDRVIPSNANIGFKSKVIKVIPRTVFQLARTLKFFFCNKKKYSLEVKQLFRWIFFDKYVKELLKNASFICVNSSSEKEHLIQRFNLEEEISNQIVVIRNGINVYEEAVDNPENNQDNNGQPYICCVGGIGPRKNQINLVKAANKTGVNLYIIGKSNERDKGYEKKIRKMAKPNIKFLGYLDHAVVLEIIRNAKGVIQPSFIETPGLASMEAFSLGIPIAVSDVPPVREYFNEVAIFVDPNNVDSIADALLHLVNIKKPDEAKIQKFNMDFNWSEVLKPLIPIIYKSSKK